MLVDLLTSPHIFGTDKQPSKYCFVRLPLHKILGFIADIFNIVLNNATGDDIELKALKVSGATLTESDMNVSKGSSATYGGTGAPAGTAGKAYKVSITVTYDTKTSAGATELPGIKTTATCLGTYNG